MDTSENFYRVFDSFTNTKVEQEYIEKIGILKKTLAGLNLDYFTYDKVMTFVASLKNLKIKNSAPVDPSQATNKASSTSTDDHVSKEGSPQQEDAPPGLQEILVLLYKTLIKRIRKEHNIPIQIKAKWYENVDDNTRNSLGIAVLGGGEASQCWSIALYNALFNFGMLNKKYVDTIRNISVCRLGWTNRLLQQTSS